MPRATTLGAFAHASSLTLAFTLAPALIAPLAPGSSVAWAADLDKKQARDLEKVGKSLAKTQEKLESYERGDKSYSDRAGESLLRALEGAVKKVERLPADGAGVGDAQRQIETLRARVQKLVEAKGSLGAKSGLEGKQQKSVNYLDQALQNLMTEMGNAGPDGKWSFSDRNKDRFQRMVSDLEADLGKLPADNDVVKGLLERAKEVKARLAGLSQALAEKKEAAAESEAKRQALLDDPSYAKDTERAKALAEVFRREGHHWDLTARFYKSAFAESTYQGALESAQAWAQRQQDWKSLNDKYGALTAGRGNPMFFPLKSGRDDMPKYAGLVATFRINAPTAIASAAARVRELAKKAVADKDHRAFSNLLSELRSEEAYVNRVAAVLQAVGGPDHTGVGKSLADELSKEEEKLAEVIVAENRLPKDNYQGEDGTTLRSFVASTWKENFPDEEVLAVRFPDENLYRTVAWKWDNVKKEHFKVDHSGMWIRVAVRGQKGEAIIYRALVRRLHLQDDKLILRWSRPKQIAPSSRMLEKNIE